MSFIKELQTLMAKYEADISFDCGQHSDLHGVYDERIVIEIKGKEVFRNSGYVLQAGDLDE
jgi:hypothetical protein